jgi:murein DD-endopeptidase MepM/ murein hydrolase activator NlpD
VIGPTALAGLAPGTRAPRDLEPDEAVRYQFARLLAGELRKALPKGEGFDVLEGLGPVLDDALARSLVDRLPAAGRPHPHDVEKRVTSGFGNRIDPVHGRRAWHAGVDVAAPEGTAIRAVRDGTVVFSGKRGGYGNLVILDHGDGVTTRYAHCRDLGVRAGDTVRAGQDIATVGSTGRSTGPHVHLEMRRNGHPVAPDAWIDSVLREAPADGPEPSNG